MSELKIGRVVPAPGVPSEKERMDRIHGQTLIPLRRIRELEAALAAAEQQNTRLRKALEDARSALVLTHMYSADGAVFDGIDAALAVPPDPPEER